MKKITLLLSVLLIFGCKDKTETKIEPSETKPSKVEIITKSFSTKTENGAFVKDTVNMIQSIIVDDNDKEIANIYYELDGSESWKDIYQYDDAGRKIGSKYYEKGIQKSYYEYDLDSFGRRIGYRTKEVNTDTLIYDGASRYENNGLLRKDGYVTKDGVFKWNYEYYFDADGKELGYAYVSSKSGKKFPRDYKYIHFNKDGKWTERHAIENDTVVGIEVREFKAVD